MFNDLNQAAGQQPKAPVDDIFAETDKAAEVKKFSGYYSDQTAPSNQASPTDIETQKIGLSASEDLPTSKKGKIIKVALVVILVLLLLSLGYLVYAKFLSGKNVNQNQAAGPATSTDITNNVVSSESTSTNENSNTSAPATNTIPVSEEVSSVPTMPITTTTPPVSNLADTDGDSLTDEEEAVLGTDPAKKDTDGDGLTDYEEAKVYNTDPKKVDSDDDGLSDYEEIKIYHTDPLKADTDGDSYSDGQEVKTGYNPLGAGKMTGEQQSAESVK